MKSAIQRREVDMFLESMSKNSIVPKRDIESASPSQELGLASCLSLYRMENNLRPCEVYVFVSQLDTFLSCGLGMLLDVVVLF